LNGKIAFFSAFYGVKDFMGVQHFRGTERKGESGTDSASLESATTHTVAPFYAKSSWGG